MSSIKIKSSSEVTLFELDFLSKRVCILDIARYAYKEISIFVWLARKICLQAKIYTCILKNVYTKIKKKKYSRNKIKQIKTKTTSLPSLPL